MPPFLLCRRAAASITRHAGSSAARLDGDSQASPPDEKEDQPPELACDDAEDERARPPGESDGNDDGESAGLPRDGGLSPAGRRIFIPSILVNTQRREMWAAGEGQGNGCEKKKCAQERALLLKTRSE